MRMRFSSQHYSSQKGAALLVALVALVVLTVLGVTTMGDVLNQSTVVRNEQFRQKVFYGAMSELNVQINRVNRNEQNEDDPIIDYLLGSNESGRDMSVLIEADQDPKILTNPQQVNLSDVSIYGNRLDNFGCPGESIGKVKVIAGNIGATATLDDGRGSIKSVQKQNYVYCWP